MNDSLASGFHLGDRAVSPDLGRISSPGGEIHVEPRAMQVLVALARRSGDTVSRDELIEAVWKHPHVTDEALSRCISVLRQALGDDGSGRRLIETIPKRGYRLVVPVQLSGAAVHALSGGVAPDSSKTNLTLPLTRLIGRETELAEVRALLARDRLVTLTGSAGVGKTRLAIELGREAVPGFADGVWLVELAPLADPTLIASTVATVLGIELGHATSPHEKLAQRIGERNVLLILDNCEHLVEGAAALAESLLGSAVNVRILATSQAGLGIAGEQLYRVPSLATPDDDRAAPEEVLSAAAAQLFVERAKAADSHFGIERGNALAIAAICRQLDGIPLAIEMAAARAPLLGIEPLARLLHERFRILTGGKRTALPRQQTLRATLDWSVGLLSEQERAALAGLGVFAGSFTLAAASKVLADDPIHEADVVDLLARLVARSLVTPESHATGMRYRLLETTRAYALERLDASGQASTVRNRHLRFYLDRVIEESPNKVHHCNWDGLHLDRENILAAHAWCDRAPDGGALGLKLAFELKDYWVHRGGVALGYRVTTEALARPGAQERNRARSWGAYAAALLATCMGRYEEALAHRMECLSLAREVGTQSTLIFALLSVGEHHVVHRQWSEARRYIEEALPLAREHQGVNERTCALLALGDLDRLEGRLDAAQACNEECLAIGRASSAHRHVIVALDNLTSLSLARGSAAGCASNLVEALDVCEEIGSKLLGSYTLMIVSGLAAFIEEPRRAAELHAAAGRQLDEIGFRFEPADEAFLAPLIARARDSLGEQAFAAAEVCGRALSYEASMSSTREWLKSIAPE